MIRSSLIRSLTLAGALVAAISLTGATLAATASLSTHASSTAVAAVAANGSDENADQSPIQNALALAVSTAAGSDTVGGAQQNHGGYVSCVARGGSDCTSTTPTLPSHGTTPTLPTQAQNGDVPAR
jgi:hypothetical protein